MATIKRRTRPAAEPSPAPKGSRHQAVAAGDGPGHPPVRMNEVTRELGEPPYSFGVDPAGAKAALAKFLRRDKGSDRPFCTCGEVRGWSFDCQIGVYIHADPKCWKPSKGYYEAALRAGLLGEVPLKDAS